MAYLEGVENFEDWAAVVGSSEAWELYLLNALVP